MSHFIFHKHPVRYQGRHAKVTNEEPEGDSKVLTAPQVVDDKSQN